MREILFRGISKVDGHHAVKGGFVYGNYIKDYDSHMFGKCDVIMFLGEDGQGRRYPIEKDSAEQFTGLLDKNNSKIFEGDIIKAWSEGLCAVGEVIRRIDGLLIIYPAHQKQIFWGLMPNLKGETSVEVIGNIHENPELMEVNK